MMNWTIICHIHRWQQLHRSTSTDTVECWVLHVTIINYTLSTVMRWWATITQHCYVMVCRLGGISMGCSRFKASKSKPCCKESRATLACLYRTSWRFYMLQLISVYSWMCACSETISHWKGSWADVDWKCPTFLIDQGGCNEDSFNSCLKDHWMFPICPRQ